MAPKQAAQKEKIAVDKTFGLKNKNKSKSVQKYIKNITQNTLGVSSKTQNEEKKEKDQKANQQKNSALMASLFNLQTDKKGRAYDPKAKAEAKKKEEEALAAGRKVNDEIKKDIIEGVANTIRLTDPKKGLRMSELGGHAIIQALKTKHADTFKTIQLLLFIKAHEKVFWLDDAESTNPTVRCMEDVEAETAPDERPLEEIIEERRRNLTGGGTPVTQETFKAWKEKKAKEKEEKEEREREDQKKKAGGKATAVMSGRELFSYDASLFKDDEDAASDTDLKNREDTLEDRDDSEEESSDDEADKEAVEESKAEEEAEETGASSSKEVSDVVINKDLFLQEADEDLDDLDDLDDDEEEKAKA